MRRTKLMAVALLLAILFSACGNAQELALGRYVSDTGGVLSSALVLEYGNRYSLMGPAYVSFIQHGEYTVENERLLLSCGHVFIVHDTQLTFERGEWLENFVEPGTRFYLT